MLPSQIPAIFSFKKLVPLIYQSRPIVRPGDDRQVLGHLPLSGLPPAKGLFARIAPLPADAPD